MSINVQSQKMLCLPSFIVLSGVLYGTEVRIKLFSARIPVSVPLYCHTWFCIALMLKYLNVTYITCCIVSLSEQHFLHMSFVTNGLLCINLL
jgi:hypothetical protein